MSAAEVVLVDLSSIAHPIWHMSQSEPDPNHASTAIVARVRALTSSHPHAAICCDAGRSFRHDIAATYKANRPEAEAPLHHQIKLAREVLLADGFPVWAVRGFEADDLIATGVARAVALGLPVLIVSADKDLLQLVAPTVRAMSAIDGSIRDEAAVVAKFGVKPSQIRDYLTLVGDSSDNIKGAAGIGPKKAADLLTRYESLEGVYEALSARGSEFKPAMATALREFGPRMAETRALVTLCAEVDVPFDEITKERQPAQAVEFEAQEETEMESANLQPPTVEPEQPKEAAAGVEAAQEKVIDLPGNGAVVVPSASRPNQQLAVREAEILPAPYERQLDPRSMSEAQALASNMFASRLFSAYGNAPAVLSTVMLGRELGLPAMAALRGVHIIEGRHALSAQTMVALILKSGLAAYFRPVRISETSATYITLRKGEGNEPFELTHTIEMATTAGLVKPNSNWVKVPTDMLCSRASSRLARLIYPDIVGGLYTPDELSELKAAA